LCSATSSNTGDPDLGEGGAPAPRRRFRGCRGDLGRIRHTVLGAVDRQETPAAPEGLRLLAAGRDGPQRPPHQVGKDLPRKTDPPIGPRTVGERFSEQLEKVLGQGAGAVRDMKGQRLQQLVDRDARFATAAAGQLRHPVGDHGRPGIEKARGRFRRWDFARIPARRR
jgi:hypothetical protein